MRVGLKALVTDIKLEVGAVPHALKIGGGLGKTLACIAYYGLIVDCRERAIVECG